MVQHDKVRETKKVNMAAACLRNRANHQQIMLMTAVAAVRGESGKEKRTRVFFDPGAQASFISSRLAAEVKAKTTGHARITIQGFGSKAETTTAPVRLISLVGTSGNTYTVEVLERRDLDLQIPQVPEDIARRWQGRGIHPVSDIAQEDIEQAVDVLIGAD